MAEHSTIEWTDATWNPITGCSVVSPGCINCYAMRLAGTRLRHHPSREGLTKDTKSGPVWTGEVRLNEQWLMQPLQWKRPRKIFVCAHGDLFAEGVPDEWIDRVFAVMALAPQHVFQVLTKRAARMRAYFNGPYPNGDGVAARIAEATTQFAPLRRHLPEPPVIIEVPVGPRLENGEPEFGWRRMMHPKRWPLPNVWLGISAERQQEADARIPDLLSTPAAVRFVSLEPLIGPIDLTDLDNTGDCRREKRHGVSALWKTSLRPRLDWVIVGGESGPDARPMHPDWARSLRDQCAAAGVPFHFKQHGEWLATADDNGEISYGRHERFAWDPDSASPAWAYRVGKKAAGRLLDGVEHNGFPEVRA